FWTAMGVYLLAAAAVLGLRYGVLPRADTWRPDIERAASRALGAEVRIAHVQARWNGLHPRFTLSEVRIADRSGQTLLEVPQLRAVLSWRSVLAWRPHFLALAAEGIEVSLRRDADNRLWLAGRAI